MRILEILQQKDEQANLNLGDPASFLNVYDPDREVQKVSEFMANGMTPAQVSATLDTQQADTQANEGDWLLQLFGGGSAASAQPLASQSSDHIEAWPGLFTDEYAFARAALSQLAPARDWLQWSTNDAEQGLALTAPSDLQAVQVQQLEVRLAKQLEQVRRAPLSGHQTGI